ncbi:siderophore-interacting protein [Catenuloplanes indicus]|uniref:NADPH-dependent ferric siderophore reductase n=1 Tax=Catenuloplanes indicus TaxID=137267 RepID=A0AAE3W7N2_9ACTN|nr:siderophore-interacting protein [Catenuloplanes indicus]MDQ0371049.1 NADPH-dependent ferric siderophore reductase [Catenuloplanes indicus]
MTVTSRALSAEVVANRRLTPHLTRITVTGPDLHGFGYDGPDHLVRIFLAPAPDVPLTLPDSPDGWWPALKAMPEEVRPVVRNYTVRRFDADRRELDIDFVLHGDGGPASAWAHKAAPGDRIGVLSDGAEYAPPADTDWQLFAGDETALPAIAAAIESLPHDATGLALIECGGTPCEIPIAAPPGVTVHWLHRNGDEPGTSSVIIDTLRALELPPGNPYAFIAGESTMVTTVRRHLCTDLAIAKSRVYFCGYWRRTSA